MFFWFIGGSVAIVWAVFHSTRLDYRLLALGAVIPGVENVTGRDWGGHTLVASVVVLAVVMLFTRSSRIARRRWLCLPIGMFCHLVLDGVWGRKQLFWWPGFGSRFPDVPSLVASRGWVVNLMLEAVGLAVLIWAWRRFELSDPERRRRLIATGTLDPSLARGPEAGM
ncbi:MAG: hypothetical protein JST73_07380 [Actinobacteria bacterium]|nr:hypothetical protein [Actinomycetota bacterium]